MRLPKSKLAVTVSISTVLQYGTACWLISNHIVVFEKDLFLTAAFFMYLGASAVATAWIIEWAYLRDQLIRLHSMDSTPTVRFRITHYSESGALLLNKEFELPEGQDPYHEVVRRGWVKDSDDFSIVPVRDVD